MRPDRLPACSRIFWSTKTWMNVRVGSRRWVTDLLRFIFCYRENRFFHFALNIFMKIPTHRLESLLDNILALILKAALLLTRAQLVFPYRRRLCVRSWRWLCAPPSPGIHSELDERPITPCSRCTGSAITSWAPPQSEERRLTTAPPGTEWAQSSGPVRCDPCVTSCLTDAAYAASLCRKRRCQEERLRIKL